MNIGYHTRLDGENSKKISGGSFGGTFDKETVERLVSAHFRVRVKPSGRPVFVDSGGREVSLYITVDPGSTRLGIKALELDSIERQEAKEKAAELAKNQEKEIADLMANLSHAEIVARLKSI